MKKGWIAIVVAALVFIGCSGIKVSQDYDPKRDFQSMRTYRWTMQNQEKTGDPRIDNPLRDTRIRTAVERILAAKGFTKTADDTPTFLVRYQNIMRRKIESDSGGTRVGFGVGSYGRRGGIAVGSGNSVREYDESTLVIDFVAPASEDLIWRGSGTQRYKEYDDPDKATSDINLLVEKILEPFPPINQ